MLARFTGLGFQAGTRGTVTDDEVFYLYSENVFPEEAEKTADSEYLQSVFFT